MVSTNQDIPRQFTADTLGGRVFGRHDLQRRRDAPVRQWSALDHEDGGDSRNQREPEQ